MVEFFVQGIPETKGSWRAVAVGVVKPDNPRERAWADAVGWAAKAQWRGKPPTRRPVAVEIEFVLPAPVGKKNRRDIDKLIRSVLDAITGILIADDELVVEVHATKVVADSGHGARVRVSERLS